MGFRLIYNENIFSRDELAQTPAENNDPVLSFCRDWLTGQNIFIANTSGSTGPPCEIQLHRQAMKASAAKTLEFFKLKPGNKALLCINPSFIGGKMMLVRAMERDMIIQVVAPSSEPVGLPFPSQDFISLVPLQLYNMLSREIYDDFLNQAKAIIVGGGVISRELSQLCQRLRCPVYSTYGMTETVSHIALRKINANPVEDTYSVLPGIAISIKEDGRLIINGDVTNGRDVITNDIVEIVSKTHFKWLGRKDNIINSGGIKIQAEQVESKIEKAFVAAGLSLPFFICGVTDKVLGEKIILVIESDEPDKEKIMGLLKNYLGKYEVPKEVYFTKEFRYTSSQKPDRRATVLGLGFSDA